MTTGRAGPHVVSDLDREVPDDAAAPPDQAAVADDDRPVAQALLAGHHPGRERHVRADDGAGPDVDEPLVHERGRREADHAARTERAEPPAPPAVRSDRAELDRAVPRPPDRLTGGELQPTPNAVDDRGRPPLPMQHDGRH
jgi:hypothetical protein